MRIAIIGCGSIGSRHARNIRALGHDVIPVDTVHARAASLAVELGVSGWSEELLAFDGVDAVMICSPLYSHESVAERLLQAGYAGPLFVEKPLTLFSRDRCRPSVFERWPHPVTMVGYNLRFHHAVAHMRQVQPTAGRFTMHCDSRLWPGAGYGELLLECSHEIDLAVHLGAPTSVTYAFLFGDHEAEIRIGETWAIHLNDRADRYLRRWDVFGEARGCSHIFSTPGALGDGMYLDELHHFLMCVDTGRPTAVPFSQGLRVVEICERVKELAA